MTNKGYNDSAPLQASSRARLSCRRRPFRNQWMETGVFEGRRAEEEEDMATDFVLLVVASAVRVGLVAARCFLATLAL